MADIIRLVKIPHVSDDCLLYFAENPTHINFLVKRFYFISKANPKLPRGHHAHKKTDQLLLCIQGKVKMIVDDGKKREEVVLDKPNVAIELPRMLWHEMHDFEEDTILLVLASRKFEPEDYIRNYEDFLLRVKNTK